MKLGGTPNVILLVLDTLRRDSLGVYGGERTPCIDRLAEDSLVFLDAVAPSPWTLPSHVSLFTGKYASEHGVHESKQRRVGPELMNSTRGVIHSFLAEELRRRGYNTIGLSGNPMLLRGSGVDRGFNLWYSRTGYWVYPETEEEVREYSRALRSLRTLRSGSTLSRILRLLSSPSLSAKALKDYLRLMNSARRLSSRLKEACFPRNKGGERIVGSLEGISFEAPLFLFLNLFEVHEPYPYEVKRFGPLVRESRLQLEDLAGLKPLSERDVEGIRSSYRSQVKVADSLVCDLLKFLKGNGLYQDSLLILTSDHGQSLKERGYYGHGIFLYDELVRVPLMVKLPKARAGRVEGPFSLVEIPQLIGEVLEGGNYAPRTGVAYAESFGVHSFLPEHLRDRLKWADAKRLAVFYRDTKVVLNGDLGEVEEMSVNSTPLPRWKWGERVGKALQLASTFEWGRDFLLPPAP